MLTPKGRPSCKIAPGTTFRKVLLMENIARLELKLVPVAAMSNALGVSPVRIGQIKRSAEYLRLRESIRSGVIAQMDLGMYQSEEYKQNYFQTLMPAALRVLAEQLLQRPSGPAGQALQAKIAMEFLDRVGTFAKVSRTEVKAQVSHNYSEVDEVANSVRAPGFNIRYAKGNQSR